MRYQIKPMAWRQYRIIRFICTGGLATLTHISVAFAVLNFITAPVWLANLIGFSCAFGVSYLLQTQFVFQKSLSWKNLTRFFIVQFSALLISQLVSEILADTNPYLRVLWVVGMIPIITYLIHRIWTFQEQSNFKSRNTHEH